MSQLKITLCGHGSGTPSLKNMTDYCASRYNQIASNGKRKQVVAVRRFKGLTAQNRQAFHDAYKTILGRNQYSQALRTYVYTPYHGVYYSDCSSSGCYTLKHIGLDCPDLNTAGIYSSGYFESVPVNIAKGQITNPECLQVGDALLFVGNDPSRPLQIGHVEFVYEIEGGDVTLTNDDICKSVANIAKRAKNEHWQYGDCQKNPPCPPIACDRGIMRALWDLDARFRDQKAGGETVYTADSWLVRHGFEKNTDQSKVKDKSIILMKWNGAKAFHWKDHMFYCVSYNAKTGKCCKYDFGRQERIDAGGYFANVAFNEWPDKHFYASYRLPDKDDDCLYVTPEVLTAGTTSQWCYIGTEILKARGCMGITDKTTHKRKPLQNNFQWTIGDMAAATEFRLKRACEGQKDLISENAPSGNFTMLMWEVVFGGKFPFKLVPVPEKETKGLTVLKIQEFLRAREIPGANGQLVSLDRTWGPSTEAAFREYQRRMGGPVDGKVSVKWLKEMFGVK